jgi:hypothetical protein
MQANYRAIFAETLLVQSAAMEAFASAAARCTMLTGQQYQQAFMMLVRKVSPNSNFDISAHPGGDGGQLGASAGSIDIGPTFASLPRLSMMIFLSRYNDLRGRRDAVKG